jgi:hypothetical protein
LETGPAKAGMDAATRPRVAMEATASPANVRLRRLRRREGVPSDVPRFMPMIPFDVI